MSQTPGQKPMRVLYVVPSFYPAIYHGGPILSGYQLCNGLARQGIELRVLTTDTNGPNKRIRTTEFPTRAEAGYLIYYCRRMFDVSVSPGLLWRLFNLIRWADVVYLTAVYSFPTIPTLLVCRLLNKPVVWSPRGSLQRWPGTRRAGLKYLWEKICAFIAPKETVLHVTSDAEAQESQKRFPKLKYATVPHGVEIPDQIQHIESNGRLRILYLGRLDPKKGIENLLQALSQLKGEVGKLWSVTIAGDGEALYTESIKQLINQLGIERSVEMLGEVIGDEKEKLFEFADVVIVPSYSENFGIVVVEALSHGVPVIASKGTPWKRLEEMKCGLWVDNSPASLAIAIEKMYRLPRREFGQRGREWMAKEFSWDQRTSEMIALYNQVLKPPIRVLYLTPSFYPAIYHGGPIFAGYHLCNTLAKKGVDVRVLTTDTNGPGQRLEVSEFPIISEAGYPIYYCRRVMAVSVSPGLLFRMVGMIRWADVVDLNAVYSFPIIPALLICKLLGKAVVWSPNGALQRWHGSRRVKLKAVWDMVCRMVAPKRIALHVTSQKEGVDSKKRFPKLEVFTVPESVQVPEQSTHKNGNGTLRLLYLGRLDPIKGIENLVSACTLLNNGSRMSWSLTIAGTGEAGYAEDLRRLVQENGLNDSVSMVGQVKGKRKRELFEQSDLLVLPSHQESFGMVAAEALAAGLPVIASKWTPWNRLEEIGCGLWVDNDQQSLATAIKKMNQMPLQEMGQRGRQWMKQEFGWDGTAERMKDLYNKVLAM
jgi:glycosyltransferase involved in cell wall biosynthesis